MTKLEQLIVNLKKLKRDNFYFLKKRDSKRNGKKTLGWICKRDDTDKVLENIDFYKLKTEKNKLKEISNERNKNA